MWQGFNILSQNLNIGIENIIFLVLLLGGLMFVAKNFKLGLIYWFFVSGGCFMWFFAWHEVNSTINYVPPLVVMFMVLIIMALNLYSVSKSSQVGGFI